MSKLEPKPEDDEIDDYECPGCGAEAGHYYGCPSLPRFEEPTDAQ